MAATNLTSTLFDSLLKIRYVQEVLNAELTKRECLNAIPKKYNWSGKHTHQAWEIGDPTGASADYATALANYQPSVNKHIEVGPVEQWQPIGLTNLVIKQSRNDAGALMEAVKDSTQRGMNSLMNKLSYRFFRSSAGEIGTIGSDTVLASTKLVFANPGDIHNIKKNDELVFSATRTGALLGTGSLTVESVGRDPSDPHVILSDTLANHSGSIDAGDFVFVLGDAQANSTANVPYGLGDYVPSTAPTSGDSFTGSALDRSTDTRMSGVRVDGSQLTIENGLIDLISRIKFNNGDLDMIVGNTLQGGEYSKELGSKVFYNETTGDVGNKKPMVYLHGTVASLMLTEPHCPTGYFFGLTKDSWIYKSMNAEMVELEDFDGNKFRQSTSFAGVVGLLNFTGNLVCKAPWANGRLTLPALP